MAEEPEVLAATGQPAKSSAASQQPADNPADAGVDTSSQVEMIAKAEFDKVVGQRQAGKHRIQTLEQQLAEVSGKLDTMPSAEALQAFEVWNADRDAADRNKAIKAGDVETLERKIREPLEKQISTKDTKIGSLGSQLKNILCDQALREAAEKANAHSPSQVVALLRHRVKMEEMADGRFAAQFLDEDGQAAYDPNAQRITDAQVFVDQFLALPSNANLIKSTAAPGSGAKQAGGGVTTSERIPTTVAEYANLSPEQQEEVRSKLTREQRLKLLGHETDKPRGFV